MPSTALKGLTTPTGWYIEEEVDRKLGSGGNFCCRYIARSSDGTLGFLKAMDLTSAVAGGMQALHRLTSEYLFEQEILFFCKGKRMTRVVVPMDAGTVKVPNFDPPLNDVYYVIFECAEGDLRQQHLEVEQSSRSWLASFKALHHVAVGAHQLHLSGIAHQDIKPSNVLCFADVGSKLSDLGRVTDIEGKSPFSTSAFTGDRSYAPVEFYYGHKVHDFTDRYHSDIYMIGSLAYQLVTQTQISAVILQEAEMIMPNLRRVSFSEALPILITAFSTILSRYRSQCEVLLGKEIAGQLYSIIHEMCHPDPESRGSPRFSNHRARLSMTRYIGKFATLVRTATNRGLS